MYVFTNTVNDGAKPNAHQKLAQKTHVYIGENTYPRNWGLRGGGGVCLKFSGAYGILAEERESNSRPKNISQLE